MATEYKRYLLDTFEDEGGFRASVRRKDGQYIALRSGGIAREFVTMIFQKVEEALDDARKVADAAD